MRRQDPKKFWTWKLEPYRNDPVGFGRDLLGFKPTTQQRDFLEQVGKNSHVTVKSGHGTGKTASDAVLVLWRLYTAEHARVPCTAPTESQLRDVLWAEISFWHNKMDPFFKDAFELTTDRIYHKEYPKTWFAVARTARKERPEALQGFHGENLLYICEEASGIPEEIFTVAEGALTQENCKVVMTSNPTRVVGYFYDSHNEWKNDPWASLTFNAEESPLVSRKAIDRYAKRYGKDSDIYRVRVLGDFPLQGDNSLIPRHWVDAAIEREIEYWRPLAARRFDSCGIDIARYGENQTIFCMVRGPNVVLIKILPKQSTMKTAGQIVGLTKLIPAGDIKMDVCGIGGPVFDRLAELEHHVNGIDVGEAAVFKDLFANKRAEYYWHLRNIFEHGNISLKALKKVLEPHELNKLVKQLTSIRFEYNSSGRIAIWSKEKMKQEGLDSPDMADALMLAFADYEPELKKAKPKTECQRFIDMTESAIGDRYEEWERYAKDYYPRDRLIEVEDIYY